VPTPGEWAVLQNLIHQHPDETNEALAQRMGPHWGRHLTEAMLTEWRAVYGGKASSRETKEGALASCWAQVCHHRVTPCHHQVWKNTVCWSKKGAQQNACAKKNSGTFSSSGGDTLHRLWRSQW